MPLIGNDDLVRIDLPAEGEWVEVKRRLSRGDEIAVQRALTEGGRITAGGATDGGLELSAGEVIEAAEFAGLYVAIKRWSFSERVTPEAIRTLDGESVAAIKERLNEMYEPPRQDDERKNSPENGVTPSREKAASLKS